MVLCNCNPGKWTPSFFLTSLISVEKGVMLVLSGCCIIFPCFKIFLLPLVFNSLTRTCLYVVFFAYILFGSHVSLTCDDVFHRFRNILWNNFSNNIFHISLSLSHFHMGFQIHIMLVLFTNFHMSHDIFCVLSFFLSILQSGYFLLFYLPIH